MINRTAIQQWSEHAPWIDNAQIEQDLIICRALVSIFSDEFLASQLAFRGGTALHKLYLSQDDQLNAFSAVGTSRSPLVAAYQLLRQAEPLILERQGTKDMDAVLLDNEQREAEIVTADGFRFTIRHSYSLGCEPGAKGAEWPETACIILRLGKEDYLVIGSGVVVTFQQRIGLAKCEEVEIVDGKQRIIRHLNGDQTHQGRHVRIPVGAFQIQHFKLYRY